MSATAARIPLGRLRATPGALGLIANHETVARALPGWLARHARGECPDMSAEDQRANAEAVTDGTRMFTGWRTGVESEPKLWIVTEWDRSSTCLLLPSEY